MKVTALISDKIIEEVQRISGGKNITESLLIALNYYIDNQKLYKALDEIDAKPFQFDEDFTAYGIRKINRKR